MTEATKPQFDVIAPVFRVTNMTRSRAYYVDQLGFEVGFEWTDDGADAPRYVILTKGGIGLHLSQSHVSSPSIAYVFVDGVREYYDVTKGTDALITEHILDHPWEMREFEVTDPDGNRLVFDEHLSRVETDGRSV